MIGSEYGINKAPSTVLTARRRQSLGHRFEIAPLIVVDMAVSRCVLRGARNAHPSQDR